MNLTVEQQQLFDAHDFEVVEDTIGRNDKIVDRTIIFFLCEKCDSNRVQTRWGRIKNKENFTCFSCLKRGKKRAPFSEECKQKMSESTKGEKNPMFGNHHSKETCKKIGESSKGEKSVWFGKEHSEETKKKISESHKGIKPPKETKQKLRLARIKNIEKNYGICMPSYNKEACEYFKRFDIANKTEGRYAVNGNGEYQIKELGYFPDYINFDLKIIIEWDEKYHFQNGNLREKDIRRQKEIQEFYPDYAFIRIKQGDYSGFIL